MSMHEVLVALCPCGHETQIPLANLIRKLPHPVLSATDALYIDFACPECGLATRYRSSNLDLRTVDVATPYSPHAGKSWIGVHIRCDRESCQTHALIETVWDNAKAKDELPKIVAGWKVREITCYDGHPPKHPTTIIWDSIPLGATFLIVKTV